MIFSETFTYVAVVLIVLVCLWTIIAYPKNYVFKAIFIPVLLFTTVSLFETYQSILGYGTTYDPSEKVQYFYHTKKGDMLFVLLLGDRGEPRLYKLKYSKRAEEELEKMKTKTKGGVVAFGKFKRFPPNSAESSDGEWILYDTPFQDLVRKED